MAELAPITVDAERLPVVGSAMQPGETPERYRVRRLRELREPLEIPVTSGAASLLGRVPWWAWLLAGAAAVALARRKGLM